MQIAVTAKQVYGETKFYPACHQAQVLAEIAGTKTLTFETLRKAHAMGIRTVIDGDKSLVDMLRQKAA